MAIGSRNNRRRNSRRSNMKNNNKNIEENTVSEVKQEVEEVEAFEIADNAVSANSYEEDYYEDEYYEDEYEDEYYEDEYYEEEYEERKVLSAHSRPPVKDSCERKKHNDHSFVVGNSVDVHLKDCDSEVKAKLIVQERDSVRIWGQVVDCNNRGVSHALIKLLREGRKGLEGIAHTITDCNGFYQLEVCPSRDGRRFTILAGKASTGPERVISCSVRDNNCKDVCNTKPCDRK